jgi:hypothetical protein
MGVVEVGGVGVMVWGHGILRRGMGRGVGGGE